jgi:hypothetical protein
MTDLPYIVFSEALYGDNIRGMIIDVTGKNMKDLILKGKHKFAFSAYSPEVASIDNFYYVIQNGVLINTVNKELNHLEELYDVGKFGCKNFIEYLEILYYHILDFKKARKKEKKGKEKGKEKNPASLLREFKDSEFSGFQPIDFQNFMSALERGFTSKSEFERAEKLGIEHKNEFDKYVESGYKSYEEYLKAQEEGFETKEEFYKAEKYGIDEKDTFETFIDKYEKPYIQEAKDIEEDAIKAFQEERYTDFFQMQFMVAKKYTKMLYDKIVDDKGQELKDLKINQYLNRIEQELGRELEITKNIEEWLSLKNQVDRDLRKVDRNMAEELDQFILNYKNKIIEEFRNYNQDHL